MKLNKKRTATWPVVLGVAMGFGAPTLAGSDDITDQRIAIAIEGEMQQARHVSENRVDVKVMNGVATLSGTVPSLLEKDRAIRIASMVKGVSSVNDKLTVKASDRSTREIRNDVIAALAADPATDSWEIDVSVKDGIVTLGGAVESYAERRLAGTVAKGVKGVRGIRDEIDVEYARERADYEIRQDITQSLKWNARVDGDLISVGVEDADVTLTGSVGSAYEATLAIANAWVAGVDDVDATGLEVNWWADDDPMSTTAMVAPSIPDEAIQTAVRNALLFDPRVSSFRPQISVDNGVVTLTGMVHDLKARRAAAQTASDTVGVRRVKNYLKVRPAIDRPDDVIEGDVKAAFLRDPIVDRFDITTAVVDGTAYLYGNVDSYFERAKAEDLATRTIGVTDVENKLEVGYPSISHLWFYDWDPVLYDYDFDYLTLTPRTDVEIREDIQSELFWSPFVDADEVTVKVDDGVATLTGTVDDWSEYNAATENAIEGGAIRVVNKLGVNAG